MTPIMIVLCVLLLVAAVFLTVAILLQHGKSHNLSGTIAGASETFFGKTKGSTIDRKLSTLTTVVAIVFVVLVLVAFLIQGADTNKTTTGSNGTTANTTVSTSADTTADTTVDTTADTTADTAADTTAPVETEADTAA